MPPATEPAAADTGGAPERTRLAWRRTSLTATIAVILLLRLALDHDHRALAVTVSAVGSLCWVTAIVLIQLRVRALPAALTSAIPLVLAALGCLCLGVLGVVLIVA